MFKDTKGRECKESDYENSELMNDMINGYALHKIICDSKNDPIDYKFLEVNKAFESLTGLKARSVVGHTILEVMPEIESSWIEKYGRVALTEIPTQFENFNTQTHKHFQVTAYCPKPNHFACFFVDITEQKCKEKKLQESKKQYQSIFDNAPDGVFIVDENGHYIAANKAAEKITGYSKDELLSMSISQFYTSDGISESAKRFNKVKETGSASNEAEFLHKNGTKRWWSIDAIKLSETRFLGFQKDITKRKLAELALEKRMFSLLSPLNNTSNISFEELFNLEDIQRIQDEFSDAHRIASVITTTDGTPITSPSNFCKLCSEIRKTDLGCKNCYHSDSIIGVSCQDGPTITECLSGGLWDAGAAITVEGKHIANWLIGQVRDKTQTEESIRAYARKIGLDEEMAAKEFHKVPEMTRSQFEKVSRVLFTFANQLSNFAYQNVQQARFITELKQTESALKESKEHFASLFKDAPLGYQSLDENGCFVDVNYVWLKTLGYKREEIMGKWFGDFLHPEQAERFREQFSNFLALGSVHAELKMKHKNSEYRFIELDGRIKHNPETGFCRTHCILNDVTERKLSEQALATEKERLAVTLRSIADGVITTDIHGNIVMLNRAAENLTGWDANDAVGKPVNQVFKIINQLTDAKCESLVKRVLATTKVIKVTNNIYLTSKNGREILISKSGAPIRNIEGKVVGVVIVFRDMTEKQELDNSKQRAQKLESIGMLAGGIAHDFNNILSGVFGYVEMALEETNEEKVERYLAESLSNINRARALTQQLLTFAKGGAPIKKVENLFPFIQNTVDFALSGSSVLSKFQIQDNLWPCNFDKNQIGQVIDNLSINAQQAMPNGGNIEVSAVNISLLEQEHISLTAGNYVKLSIKDQGIGIPQEFLPQIFDPYFTTKSKGHGLGLSTSYSIIKRHGGCIDIESEMGKGSTFHVYLPATTKIVAKPVKNSSPKHSGTGTILVMDDEEAILKIMKIMLESFGYKVVLKTNGKDAIDFFMEEFKAKRKLAGMIFDITIPGGMGGKDTIKEIRKICPNTPAFVASGYSQDPIMANPEKFGFAASISKPFRIIELSRMLEKHLSKRDIG